jgi:cytochrome c-type biogenesis protein CcmE
MKIKYLIGGGILLVFAIVAVLSFNSNKIEYSNFADAKTSGKVVQIIGSWTKDMPANYDVKTSCFTFNMKDKNDAIAKVIFNGGKPNNFDIAPNIVVKGNFKGGDFYASDILTKCPSKYEGRIDELKQEQVKNK